MIGNKLIGNKASVAAGIVAGATVNLDAGDVASYPGSGTTWFDLTANSYDATLNLGVTYSSDNGGILDFNGTSGVADVNDGYSITYGTPFTVECWFNIDTWQTSFPRLFQIKNNDVAGTSFNLIYPQTGGSTYKTIAWAQGNRGGTYNTLLWDDSSNALSAGVWYQLVLTYDGGTRDSASSWKLYINSVSKTVGTVSNGFGASDQENWIGARNNTGATQWTDGKIPIFNFYNNKEFNQTEVTQNYNYYISRF